VLNIQNTKNIKPHWLPSETVSASKHQNLRAISTANTQTLKKRKNFNAVGGYMGYCFPEAKKIANSSMTRSVAQPTKIQANDANWLYEYALSIFKKLFGETQQALQHPLYAQLLYGKGELMRAKRKSDQALECFEQSLEIRRKVFRGAHPGISDCLNAIAEVYRADNRFEKAAPIYDISLEMRINTFGPTHFTVAEVKNNIGIMQYSQGRYEIAEGLYTEGLNMRLNSLGMHHPAVAQSLNNLAALLHAVGRLAEAKPLYSRALEI
jgi:tetratricopeptide (TPR) repeat protein